MDVLERGVPAELAVLDVAPEALQPRDERGDVGIPQQPGPAQPANVGDRALEVVQRELGVDVDRATEGSGALGLLGPDRRLVVGPEPSAPEPQRDFLHHRLPRLDDAGPIMP